MPDTTSPRSAEPASPSSVASSPEALDARVSGLSYEEARAQLIEIVTQLEQGSLPLEESLSLWELGEALARRCQAWLDSAKDRLETAQERSASRLSPDSLGDDAK